MNQKDYFKELYECKNKLLNELLVIRNIIRQLQYSGLKIQYDFETEEIKDLEEELKDMEVDLHEGGIQ